MPLTDVTDIGHGAAIRNMAFVVVIAVLFGALLWGLDRRLSGRRAVTSLPAPRKPPCDGDDSVAAGGEPLADSRP